MTQLDLPFRDRNKPSESFKKPVLYLIGYGINYASDRTIITDRFVAESEVLFALESNIEHIEAEVHGKPITNLIGLYRQGIPRSEAYVQVAERILNAFTDHTRVGLLVEGSPFFLDSICELLQERAQHFGIEVIYVDGRSSLDAIIQTLRIPLQHGLGIYLAESFCADGGVLDSEAVNLFFQPGNVGSDRIQMYNVDKTGICILQERLLKRYEPSQRWLLINLGESPTVSTKIIWGHLCNLDSFHTYMHSGTLVLSKNWWPIELFDAPPTEITD